MSTEIQISIKALDQFSGAFSQLSQTLRQVGTLGTETSQNVSTLGHGISGLGNILEETGEMTSGFFETLSTGLSISSAEQAQAFESLNSMTLESASALGEALVQADSLTAESRIAVGDLYHARQQENLASHNATMEAMTTQSQLAMKAVETEMLNQRLSMYAGMLSDLAEIAEDQGGGMVAIAKNLAIAEALISAYLAANKALASMPYPMNLVASGVVLVKGLANVKKIQEIPVAHGGLDYVPEDSTYLLKQGERVLSPTQNRDLSQYLSLSENTGSNAPMVIENLVIHVMENATHADALLEMDPHQIQQVVAEKLIPALDDLAQMGIKPLTYGDQK